MLTIEKLKAYGANVQEGLGRLFNNEAFYLKIAGMCLVDPNFDRLKKAMEERDAAEAFNAAHALKGSTGNLSLTPIYNPVCQLTEGLRGKSEISDECDQLMNTIMSELDKLRKLAAD